MTIKALLLAATLYYPGIYTLLQPEGFPVTIAITSASDPIDSKLVEGFVLRTDQFCKAKDITYRVKAMVITYSQKDDSAKVAYGCTKGS